MSARSAFAEHGAERKQKETLTSFTSFDSFDDERTTAANRMEQQALADVNAIVLDG